MSTEPKRLFATERRPSSSTRVREIPRLVFAPRRFTCEPLGLWPPRACWKVLLPKNCGRAFRLSMTFVGAILTNSSCVTAVTGVGVYMPGDSAERETL